MRLNRSGCIGLAVLAAASTAQAGWVIEQSNVATKSRGDSTPAEPATTRISQGRIRITQPYTVTVQDCVKNRFSIYLPDENRYWSGSFDEYGKEIMAQARRPKTDLGADGQPATAPAAPPPIDPSTLPKIVVRKTEDRATIAGYDTVKYVIESDGRLFQEVWLADTLNLKRDLEPTAYLECQKKIAAGMLGASAQDYHALYRSPDYLQLNSSGYALKTTVHHIAGSFTQETRSVKQVDVPESDFQVPPTAKSVPLGELFGSGGQ
jgi:hypothetical protein